MNDALTRSRGDTEACTPSQSLRDDNGLDARRMLHELVELRGAS